MIIIKTVFGAIAASEVEAAVGACIDRVFARTGFEFPGCADADMALAHAIDVEVCASYPPGDRIIGAWYKIGAEGREAMIEEYIDISTSERE